MRPFGDDSQSIHSRIPSGGEINISSRSVTLWLFNIAMENGPFIDDVPIKTSIYKGFSMAMLNNQMVIITNVAKTMS